MEERLQKLISKAGIASRRAAEQMIAAGRVTVDDAVITESGTKWDPAVHRICVDGRPLQPPERKVYFLLNKPRGYLSTAKDDRGRRTVLDLLPGVRERIYPVGRLDYQTEGLLLLTNDGALMQGLLHPRFQVDKTYRAEVSGELTEEAARRLQKGILLEDGMTAPAQVRVLSRERGRAKLEMTIHEGRNRQVRRMLAAVGCDVLSLERIRFAGLDVKGVPRGEYRSLAEEEVSRLFELAGKDL